MEKKTSFQNKPELARIIYGAVIAVLCITAIIIGIVAANNRSETPPDDTPPITGDEGGTNTDKPPVQTPDDTDKKPEKLTFISPVSGKVYKEHSLTVPVFSPTLEEWRVHTGIDIMTDDGAPVFAAADGEVTKVYNHPMLGCTVEVTHEGGIVSVYSNLSSDGAVLATVGSKVKSGDKIGEVGDTSISELAEEPHLHFEIIENEASVDPLTYISDAAKEASLGITLED